MTTPTPTLPAELASVLDAHGVAATVDGLLDAIQEVAPGKQIQLNYGLFEGARDVWNCWAGDMWPTFLGGPTALTALARAFAAMVEGEREP